MWSVLRIELFFDDHTADMGYHICIYALYLLAALKVFSHLKNLRGPNVAIPMQVGLKIGLQLSVNGFLSAAAALTEPCLMTIQC